MYPLKFATGDFFIDVDWYVTKSKRKCQTLALLDAVCLDRKKHGSDQSGLLAHAETVTKKRQMNNTRKQQHSSNEGKHHEEDDLKGLKSCVWNIDGRCNTQRDHADQAK